MNSTHKDHTLQPTQASSEAIIDRTVMMTDTPRLITRRALNRRTFRPLRVAIALLAIGFLGLAGCATSSRGPYVEMSEQERSPLRAEKLTREAADLIAVDDDKAERLLRDALAADLYHGPAHNNLGVIFLNRGMLYEAAGEFEWARKLMPGNPDPRMNLALTLERAGHVEDAIGTYRTALEVSPEHIQSIQALTRLQCKTARRDSGTRDALETIALRGDSTVWREWAQRMLTTSVAQGREANAR